MLQGATAFAWPLMHVRVEVLWLSSLNTPLPPPPWRSQPRPSNTAHQLCHYPAPACTWCLQFPVTAAGLGVTFLAGRIAYFKGYR
jgi:hypothetical protein